MEFVDVKNDVAFIKEAENLDVIPENTDDEGLKEAYVDANRNTWTKTELDAYIYAGVSRTDGGGCKKQN